MTDEHSPNDQDSQPPLAFLLNSAHRDKYPHQLVARFPHIAQHISALWNKGDDLAEYFTELMVSQRPQRQGFPPEVATEILSLSLASDRIGPIKPETDPLVRPTAPIDGVWDTERAIAELEQLGVQRTPANFARAAEAGDHTLCRLFIGAGFNVDARDARQWTPLMIATFNGRETLAQELIRLGASVDATDADGYSPLHWAALNGYEKVVELLLRKGASVNASSHAGITPLLQAAARGHGAVVALLLRHAADPNITARDGSSPLLKAVANGHLKIIDLLLRSGASSEVTMQNGVHLLQIARNAKDPRVLLLIQRAAEKQRSSPAQDAADDSTRA
jgi:uncharacterized protein